ncbi:MAG: transglutaminase domain-containing protein [Lachnospiraceae bacterium]|nr:transglutaminase domain-containing protein [Lachnospiraceae bacterium]
MNRKREKKQFGDGKKNRPIGHKIVRMEDEKPSVRERGIQMLLSVISLCLLLFGIRIGLVTAFGGSMAWKSFLPPFLLAAVLMTVFVVYATPLRIGWSSVLAFGCMAIYAWRHIEDLEYCAGVIVNYVNRRYRLYLGTGRTLFPSSWEIHSRSLQENVLLTWICFVLVYLVALIALRMGQTSMGLIPVYLVFVVGLSFGKAPSKTAIGLLVVGCGIVLFLVSVKHWEKGKKKKYYVNNKRYAWNRTSAVIPASCILAVSTVIGLCLCTYIEDDTLKMSRQFQKKQIAAEEKAIRLVNDAAQYVRGLTGLGGEGMLSNSKPHYTNSKVMEVTVNFKPHTNIYLRGFTGETYKNGRWTETDEEAFRQNFPFPDNALELWNLGYDQMTKSEKFLALSDLQLMTSVMGSSSLWEDILEETDDISGNLSYMRGGLEGSIHRGILSITYVGKERLRKNGYVPYNTNFYSKTGVNVSGDVNLEKDGQKSASTFLLMSQQKQKKYVNWVQNIGVIRDVMGQEMTFDDRDADTLAPIEQYMLYAHDHYGIFNDGELPLYQELAEQYDFAGEYYNTENYSDGIEKVQRILWDNTTYSLYLKPLPMGQDYAEYFLFYQQKGYCEHYATAGTILLRESGIPARYVSGYRVDAKNFEDNGDGTYTADVLDSDAHAWTETWTDTSGWLPWEMTPSDGSQTGEEETEDTIDSHQIVPNETFQPPSDVENAREASEREKTPTPEPSPSLQPEQTASPQPADGSDGTDGGDSKSAGIHLTAEMLAVMAVVILLAACIIILLVNRIRQSRRRNRILIEKAVPGTLAVGFCTAYIVDALRTAGKKLDRDADEVTWMNILKEEYQGLLSGEEWEEMLDIVHVGAYSKQGASAGEQERFWRLCQKCLRGVAEGCFLPRRIIFYTIFKKE